MAGRREGGQMRGRPKHSPLKHVRPLWKAGESMTTVKMVECPSGSCLLFHTTRPVGVGVGVVMPADFEFRSLREASDWEPDLGSLTRPVFSRFLSFPLLHLPPSPIPSPIFPSTRPDCSPTRSPYPHYSDLGTTTLRD